MKKVKNYIDADLAKKKIARYRYWTIKDENGITIITSDDNPNNQTFEEVLDKIIADNVDAEIQVRFGTNDTSSRQNTPLFIRINESIEWIEPEDDDETIKVNGVPHKVDKNGNVNINLNTPEPTYKAEPKIENGNIDFFRQEMEMQLQGLRREHELKEEKMQVDLQNRLFEQTLKFKEMMLSDRENRINEREQTLAQKEAQLDEKEKELQGNVKGYMKQIVPALGGLAKEFFTEKDKGLSGTDKETKKEKPTKPRRKVSFSINEDVDEEVEITDEELENEIAQYEDQEPEIIEEEETEIESDTNTQNENENETDSSVHEYQ